MTAVSPELAVQESIFNILKGFTPLTDLLSASDAVWDYPPEGSSFPYVTIGADDFTEWGSHSFDGMDCSISIHSWARNRGRKSCKQIMDKIYQRLHDTNINVIGFGVALMQFRTSTILRDPDGTTYHGVQTFQMLVSK